MAKLTMNNNNNKHGKASNYIKQYKQHTLSALTIQIVVAFIY